MSSGKVILGVLAGLATGAFLGILLAPEKGADTRKKMSQKGEDFVDVLKDKFNEFLESVSEKFQEAKVEVPGPTEPENAKTEKA
jgi:gas vesicle protein